LTAYAYESGMTDSPVTAGGYTVQTGGSYPAFLTSYTYDLLNHLTLVSMTRGSTTQTRTFNYTKPGNIVGAELLSATNPENGTVIYTYDSFHRLATKTDANGTQLGYSFSYTYDAMNRLLTVAANGVTLRTYTYDSNTIDSSYSQNTAGRLATITYPVISYDVTSGAPQGTTTFTDMFSYWPSGQIIGKRLRVTKTNPFNSNGWKTQTANGNLDMSYTYNAEGKLTNVTYPTDMYNNTPQYNYSYDSMMRANAMTDQSSSSIVSGVQYGAANQVLSMNYDSGTETRTYNTMLQLTNLTFASTSLNQNITYTFPSGTNNGKISAQTDSLSGETVTYQYDSLNRLIQAQGSGWGQTYTYDGFGNLTNRAGSGTAPSMGTPVNANNNQLSSGAGYFYDANGNLLSTGNLYDVENRLRQATIPGGTIQYAYDGSNKRVWQGSFTSSGDPQLLNYGDLVSMFGIDGQLAGTYTALPAWTNSTTPTTISFQVNAQRVYFGKKLLAWMDGSGTRHSAVADRVGSVGKYYPYGEERNSPPLSSDQVKFATYTRDAATGNDYADQRYYGSMFGRFLTADPSQNSAGPNDPGSWNRFTYTRGDPANHADPTGLSDCGTGDPLAPLCDIADPSTGANTGPNLDQPCSDVSLGYAPSPAPYPAPYCQVPAEAPPPPTPKPPDCIDAFPAYEVNYVVSNFGSANNLGFRAGVPGSWILAWGALESFWGTKGVVTTNNNFFGWRGSGNVLCPPTANKGFGCFAAPGFYNSASTVLFSTRNYFRYDGKQGVAAGDILSDQFQEGASITQAFDTLAHAGYTPDAGYGAGVTSRWVEVLAIEICLTIDGKFPQVPKQP
jgi:RHS repeat-associated protein